jgi:hypothetical protein
MKYLFLLLVSFPFPFALAQDDLLPRLYRAIGLEEQQQVDFVKIENDLSQKIGDKEQAKAIVKQLSDVSGSAEQQAARDKAYSSAFSEKEIKGLIQFFESDLGKKYLAFNRESTKPSQYRGGTSNNSQIRLAPLGSEPKKKSK